MAVASRTRRWLGAALLVLPALLIPTRSGAQQLRPLPNRHPPFIESPNTIGAARAPRVIRGSRQISLATVTESEPNDSLSEATLVTLGDTISGVVNPYGDVDWYAVDLTAGTTVQFSIDAEGIGSSLLPSLGLYYADDVNGLVEPRYNDESQGWDHVYWITIPVTGRYYAMVEASWWEPGGGLDYFYTLSVVPIQPPPLGPGDPTTLYAGGLSDPLGMAAAGNGDLFVADNGLKSILRVDPAGTVSTFATGFPTPFDVVVDGFGALLVADPSTGVIRITPTGVRSIFASNFTAVSVTVDRLGDVWVGGGSTSSLEVRRYSSSGTLLATIPLFEAEGGGLTASGIAVSPTGDVYVDNAYNGIYRVTGGPVTRVITTPVYCLWDLAFDQDGYLYVTSCLGKVMLYDPAFQPVATPFARTVGGPLVFGRDADGGMTSRLFVGTDALSTLPPFAGGIVELNPAAMRAPGLRVGVDLLRMATTALRPGWVEVPYADTLRLADAPGPVTWSISAGALPAGLVLDPSTGVVSGRAQRAGTKTVAVTGSSGDKVGLGTFSVLIGNINTTPAAAANAALGQSGAVSPEVERLLDLVGNGNGRLDVADFRAYLQSIGKVAPAGRATP